MWLIQDCCNFLDFSRTAQRYSLSTAKPNFTSRTGDGPLSGRPLVAPLEHF